MLGTKTLTSLPVLKTLTRGRTVQGRCWACGEDVYEDEHSLRIHGALLHHRCIEYRPRRPLSD